MKRYLVYLSIIAASLAAMSFKGGTPSHAVTLHFHHFVGTQKLKLDTLAYHNTLGQAYSVSNFKYYLCEFTFSRKHQAIYIDSVDYYLVSELDSSSKSLTFKNMPVQDYDSISFTLGVDSTHNCSGAQLGALDPVNGMFWAWNTGYIFLKLEGQSPASPQPGHSIEYHIGGYKAPRNNIQHFGLKLFQNNLQKDIFVKVDVSALFKSPSAIDFTTQSSVVDAIHGGAIAKNCADMFSIIPL